MSFYLLLLCTICLPGLPGIDFGVTADLGFKGYTLYEPGNMNIIITAPHGGRLSPYRQANGARWPLRRSYGCKQQGKCIWTHSCSARHSDCKATTVNDYNTARVARDIADGIKEITGHRPHVVYNMLRRSKLDANREINEATFNVPDAKRAYQDYNRFIRKARSAISGAGLLLDIHGQAHKIERTELGYLIYSRYLNSENYRKDKTSIKSLGTYWCGNDNTCFKGFISGKRSLGHFMNLQRLAAVPSPKTKKPNQNSYFSGGHTVKTYGSKDGGYIDGIQMEFPKTFRRRWGPTSKKRVATAIVKFFELNYS